MARIRAVGLLLLLLSGCEYQIPPGRLACDDDTQCPSGWVCFRSFCYDSPPDAGTGDATSDGSSDAPVDAPPVTCGEGFVDGDSDGFCNDVDCDDGDRDVSPGAAESCTMTATGEEGRDEDCDGTIDESCAWHFGEPHWITDTVFYNLRTVSPRHSEDGLSLFHAVQSTTTMLFEPFVARREDIDARFSPGGMVPGDWGSRHVAAIDVSLDGLEALIQVSVDGEFRIEHARRDRVGMPFGTPVPIPGDQNLIHPVFSDDGLEAFASSPGGIFASFRTSTEDPFPSFSVVSISDGGGMDSAPQPLGPRWLLFRRASDGLVLAERSGETATRYDRVESLDGAPDLIHFSYDPRNRELIFTTTGPWNPIPGGEGLWRAEVCRDGPCPTRRIDCTTGTPSPDGTHCYELAATSGGFDAVADACGVSRAAHVASVHSPEEQDLIFTVAGEVESWVGIRSSQVAWSSSERFTQSRFGAPLTMPGACIGYDSAGDLIERSCDDNLPAVCERETWPVW